MKNKNNIKYYFDKEADILYFTKGDPEEKHISREIDEGIIARIDPKTSKIVGFTILNFLKRQVNTAIELPLSAEFEMIR